MLQRTRLRCASLRPVQTFALVFALPTLLAYIILGRYFMSGLLAGSIKG